MTTGNGQQVRPEDVFPVRSRVSWPAIFAGAAVALAVYFLLGSLATALGLSILSERGNTGERTVANGAFFIAVFSALVALFIGGFVATQTAVGENRSEAVIHGIVLWGVTFVALVWLGASVAPTGLPMRGGVAPDTQARAAVTEQDLREAGLTPTKEQLDNLNARLTSAGGEIKHAADDPRIRAAAWWSFAGILLSMGAAVAGALCGAGPTFEFHHLSGSSRANRLVTTASH
jgi:hypothetical protein